MNLALDIIIQQQGDEELEKYVPYNHRLSNSPYVTDHPYSDQTIAPLWQQVVDWFETKGIFISICYAAPDTNMFSYRIDNYNMVCTKRSFTISLGDGIFELGEAEPSGSFGEMSEYCFKTRIEATQAAIEYSLTLI